MAIAGRYISVAMFAFALCGQLCEQRSRADEPFDYVRDIKPLLRQKCYACHGAQLQESELRLDTGQLARQGGDSGEAVIPGDADGSLLIERVSAEDESERMPPEGEAVTDEQIAMLRAWIAAGAVSPDDERPQQDPREHWAYTPPVDIDVDIDIEPVDGDARVIDAFIRRRLDEAGLKPAPAADRVTLVRRLFFDVMGLPPTPDEVAAFVADESADAYRRLVDAVLASPRYGERWAQHWLDVVRYADTHGYEVNTPREHAWPYRDYVIRALNEDKPYDRFVFEQLAGDTVGEDAATGFMVAAAALLPGQIGQDDVSKRLARQDALDEIVVGTGASFLGLTIGCARCHDHKFDPITQHDYYAVQAFFAGVDYGDREIRDADYQQRRARAEGLSAQIATLDAQLRQIAPPAFTGHTLLIDDEDVDRVTLLKTKQGHGENPAGEQRGYREDAGADDRLGNLSRGRYTWWNAIPAEDIFTWNPGTSGRYRLWISWGAHGGGAHASDARYVLDRDGELDTKDDQEEIAKINQTYFSGVTEGPAEKKPLWSGLYDAGIHDWTATSRLVLRGGAGAAAVAADVIVLQATMNDTNVPSGQADGEADTASELPKLRGPVNAAGNEEHFAAVEAKYVRFTVYATIDDNLHEPCIDELEVFTAGEEPWNVALAEHGTVATSSGNYAESGGHQLGHINDGLYGNEQSWISNEHGGGWVQLELPEVTKIDHIGWARDREQRYSDRLPVRYEIDVSPDGTEWTTVARSDDRVPLGTPHDDVFSLLRNQPTDSASVDLSRLVEERQQLDAERDALEAARLVFAGTFREPDATYVLNRGDPEQKQEEIGPQVPVALGALALEANLPDQQRRVALARWIASPDNPLTARVMVNRIWQQHFGQGLVDTPSDFGINGSRPSHPELLDWLSCRFVEDGWSLKRLHRRILLSDTYRQSSRVDAQAAVVDADIRLLWRYPSRRLEAEAIRDSMLHVCGRLNLEMGGPGFDFFTTRGGLSGFPPKESFGADELRRMVYAHKIRMEPVPVFGAFDCPDAGQATPRRSQSTTAIQALNLFNSDFVAEQAAALAERVRSETSPGVETSAGITAQVDRAFLLTLARRPSEIERRASTTLVREHGLPTLCRVLLNSSEFLFVP